MTTKSPTFDLPSPRPQSGATPVRGREFDRARRHSRRVRLLKIGLPAVAGLMALVFVAIAFVRAPGNISMDIASTSISDGKLVMANPKLGGVTRDNERYFMSAERAIQDMTGGDTVLLEKIAAELPFSRGNSATVTAASGIFDRAKNNLTIDDILTIRTEDGLEAVLQSAFFDMATNRLETTEPVAIKLDGARLVADSMTTEQNGHVIVFENRVRLNIDPGGLPALASAGAMLSRN